MRSKTKRVTTLTIFAVLLALLSALLLLPNNAATARAATTPKYTVSFDYTCYYQYNTSKKVDSSGTGTTSATVKDSRGKSTTITISIYGSASSGTGTLANGGTIKSDTVNIVISSGYQWHSMTVTNSSGQEVGKTSTTTLKLTGLSDGRYTFSGREYGQGWNPNPRAYATYSTEYSFSFVVDTYVDNTKPTISGASTSTTGKYTNKAFTVTASDTGSGVDKLYWMPPNSGSYSSTSSTSKTFSVSSANGLYRFYATDKFGNKSLTYYVYLDTVAPSGTFSLENGNTIASGGSTKERFRFSATDSGSGVSKLEYRTPSSSVWKTYTSGTYIQPTEAQGLFYFRATDKAGNTSTYTITTIHPCAEGHTYVPKVTLPTCTAGGYTRYTCSVCGSSYTGDATQALGHSYTASTTTASCTNGGYTRYTCERCGDSYTGNPTAPAGHSFSASVTDPTCTSAGYTAFTCTRCGYGYTGEETQPLGHSYAATTEESTCTEEGYTTYKCTRCGVSYTDNPTGATGHSYVASITEPTCTERGYTIYTCTKCGDSYRDNETAAIGHNYVQETVSATCTEHGGIKYTCTRCGISYNGSQSEPLGHVYVTETVAATCEEGGYTKHTCSRCGDSYTDNQSQPLGHNFIMTTKEESCEEFGMTVYTCQVCGYERTEETGAYPTGHNYSNFIVKAATCTEDGERRYVCDKCGDEYTEVIAAPGHSYAITDSASENGKTTRVYTCTVCGDSYTQELGDQYDEVTLYVEDLFEQYRPYMIWVILATAAIWSIVMGVFFAIAQKNEDKEKAKRMLVNYFVGLVVIFCILVACPYLIRGIAALVT